MTNLKKLISIAVLGIGLYMVGSYWGPVSPPLLSGIAFSLLGIMNVHRAFACCKNKTR